MNLVRYYSIFASVAVALAAGCALYEIDHPGRVGWRIAATSFTIICVFYGGKAFGAAEQKQLDSNRTQP